MPELLKSCSLFLFIGLVYYLKQNKEVTVCITLTTLYLPNWEILLNKIIIKYMFKNKVKRYNVTYNMFLDFVECNF